MVLWTYTRLRAGSLRGKVIERPAHVERGHRHERADGEPDQPVFAEGGRVEAAHQQNRQKELKRLVERLHHAERGRGA